MNSGLPHDYLSRQKIYIKLNIQNSAIIIGLINDLRMVEKILA